MLYSFYISLLTKNNIVDINDSKFYFSVMVYLCNIKMSANTIRHQSNTNYDIEDFINQLLASQKFDELAEKVADKAVNKLKNIETPPARLERFSDINSNDKPNKSEPIYRETINREYDKEVVYNKNTKLRDNPQMADLGKIDTEAVMKTEASSQAENLRLKYKYLTRNAHEKKVFNERTDNAEHNTALRNKYEKPERTSKENVKKGSNEDVPHNSNTEGRIFNIDDTEKEQHGPKKVFNEEDHNRYENRDNGREASDSNRNSHNHENAHEIHEDRHEDNIKKERSREDPPPRFEKEMREARSNDKPEFKSKVKTKTVGLVRSLRDEEAPTSFEEDKQDKVDRSTEKSKDVEDTENEETKKSTQEDNDEEETDAPVLRAEEHSSAPDVKENKVTSSNENSDQDEEESQEISTTTTKKPRLRKEGDKVYTFVDHPDYEEYHEQVAKLEKKKEAKANGYGSV